MAQSQSVFEEQPLLGVRLGLEALAIAPTDETATHDAAARLVIDQATTGRSLKVDRNVAKYGPDDGQAAYIMIYQSGTSEELRRTIDGARLLTFGAPIYDWAFSARPEPRYLSVIYQSGEYEVRRTLDGAAVFSLTNQSTYSPSRFSPDRDARFYHDAGDFDTNVIRLRWSETGRPVFTPTRQLTGIAAYIPPVEPTLFIAAYRDGLDELRGMSDGALIDTLPYSLASTLIAPGDAPSYFMITDETLDSTQPSQLRRVNDGQLIEQLPGRIGKAYFSPDPTAPYFVVDYWGLPSNELRSTVDGTRAVTLTNDLIYDVAFDSTPGAPYFGLQYGSSAELRRTSDGGLASTLDQPFRSLYFSANSNAPYFVMSYGIPRHGELRRVNDTSVVETLPDAVRAAYFSAEPSFLYFVVAYDRAPSELRRLSDGAVVETLAADAHPYFMPKADVFIVGQENPNLLGSSHGELRSATTGKVVEQLPDTIDDVYFPDPNVPYLLLRYDSALPELRDAITGKLVAKLPERLTGANIKSCFQGAACQSGS